MSDFLPGNLTDAAPGNPFWNNASVGNLLTAGTIALVVAGTTALTLSCSEAAGGTAPYFYQWYRSTASGFTPDNTTLLSGQTALLLLDTGLSPSTTYYYVLVVTDTALNSATSAEFAVTTLPAGVLPLGIHPDYIVAFQGAGQFVYVGATLPLKWKITRKDGQNVELPTAGTLVITKPDGTTTSPTLYSESNVAVTPLVVDGLCAFAAYGGYVAVISVTMPDGQVLVDEQVIACRAA